ncbi:MAG: ATP-dependent DNA helicase RecG [Candidatus Omnitrophica bacterium]|nr:ATP-dependent DNA helicase RecG [Candidatus Omnitrophota bacterium]
MNPAGPQAQSQPLESAVQYIKGVGPARYALLQRLGVETISDLIHYYPRRYEDRRVRGTLAEAAPGETQALRATVSSVQARRLKDGRSMLEALLSDAGGSVVAVWFNQDYLREILQRGREYFFYGKLDRHGSRVQMMAPEIEAADGPGAKVHMGRMVPVYPLTEDLTQRAMRQIMWNTLAQYGPQLEDWLPQLFDESEGWPPHPYAIREIHFPMTQEAWEKARQRLVREEFLVLQSAVALRRYRLESQTQGVVHTVDGDLTRRFLENLPFTLTGAQKRALKHITVDMAQPYPMHRLLQGDVGSGKTVVAAYAVVTALQGGFQAVLMAPTEILARQHAQTLSELLEPVGIEVVLLKGDLQAARKQELLRGLKAGKHRVAVGTHALIQSDVEFKRLGLVIVDEQHKFGVMQRNVLLEKGECPDILVMSATPIPRSLALTLYGDLNLITLDELPPGRKPVRTLWLQEEEREKLDGLLEARLKEGLQVYIVYPLVEDTEAGDLKSATAEAKKLAAGPLGRWGVELIHGRMKAGEKAEAMARFKAGEAKVLVATTIVEVGVDVPQAGVMVVEHADRFGLSQLHQLRGRVGRGTEESYCVLVSTPKTDVGLQRLEAMTRFSSGFDIAEEDLRIRGPGEFFGTRQHGVPLLRLARLQEDEEHLQWARAAAQTLVEADPRLESEANRPLRERVKQILEGSDTQIESI